MLPRTSRLHTAREFAAVVRSGRRAGTETLVVHLLARDLGSPGTAPCTAVAPPPALAEPVIPRVPPEAAVTSGPRAGFVVTRKIGNAVTRHRITRQLRPLVRRRLADLPAGVDVVIRALPAAAGAASAVLERDLDRALGAARRKAGLDAPGWSPAGTA